VPADTVQPAADSAAAPISLVVDYSPTVSDVTALLALTQDPDVDLLAVTLPGTGESHCADGVPNTLALLALVGLHDVPVACGADVPLGPATDWPESWREAADALAGAGLEPDPEAAPNGGRGDAVDLIARVVAEHANPVTILALGPLTNLALAVERHPEIVTGVATLYTMGGAIDVAGNAPNGTAEWNYAADPTAVSIVLAAGWPITIVPLDATDRVPVTRAWFEQLARHHVTAAATAVHGLMDAARPFETGFFFWDELTAAVVLDESLVTLDERTVAIVTAGSDRGALRPDPDGAAVRIASAVDTTRFEDLLLETLNGGVPAPIVAAATDDEVAYFEAVGAASRRLDDALSALFESPAARRFDEIVGEDDGPVALTEAEEGEIRIFMVGFWTGALDRIGAYRAELDRLDVPDDLDVRHEEYVTALDAVEASRDERVASLEQLHGEELVSSLWAPSGVLERAVEACDALQTAATERDLTIAVCPS
jgi:inosine-uridine nucleoside N-ribohydrolase